MSVSEAWAEWDLSGLAVTQIRIDSSFQVHLWKLDRDLLLQLTTPFTYHQASGAAVIVDPEALETVVPALAVLHQSAIVFRASSLGRCELRFADGSSLTSQAQPAYEAWESHGSGALESASLLATIGPGSPWGSGPPPSMVAV
jgi:hypothetical protein